MIARRPRKPYWRETKWQAVRSLLPLALAAPLPFFIGELNAYRFLGFPLGYFLAGHGLAVLAIALAAWHARQQGEIDRWHGAHDDR